MQHEINLKTIQQMVWEDLYNHLLDIRTRMSEKHENLIKKAISTAYTQGLKDWAK